MGLRKEELDTKVITYLPPEIMAVIVTGARNHKLSPGRYVKKRMIEFFTPELKMIITQAQIIIKLALKNTKNWSEKIMNKYEYDYELADPCNVVLIKKAVIVLEGAEAKEFLKKVDTPLSFNGESALIESYYT